MSQNSASAEETLGINIDGGFSDQQRKRKRKFTRNEYNAKRGVQNKTSTGDSSDNNDVSSEKNSSNKRRKPRRKFPRECSEARKELMNAINEYEKLIGTYLGQIESDDLSVMEKILQSELNRLETVRQVIQDEYNRRLNLLEENQQDTVDSHHRDLMQILNENTNESLPSTEANLIMKTMLTLSK